MPSLVWSTVYSFLLAELGLTAILVVPVPRRVRNSIAKWIFKFNLGGRLAKPLLFIGIALAFALVDSYLKRDHIANRMVDEHAAGIMHSPQEELHFHHNDKEKKYKAERNMYLSGFALTLLFVIARITTLMQENVELDHEAHPQEKKEQTKEEIEMVKPKNKTEKKKD
jgi:B-cell receptor-associated protein 31